MNSNDTITQKELQARFGWSQYLARKICRGMDFVWHERRKHYGIDDIRESITARLTQPKLRKKTQTILSNTLDRLDGKSNVVEVDFLNKLPFDQQMAFLMEQREKIRAEGHESIKRAKALIEKVDRMGLG